MADGNGWEVASFGLISLLNLCGLVAAVARGRQSRDISFLALGIPLALMTIAYAIFTYNQYHALSNSPYRYYLRFINGVMPVSIMAMCWLGWQRHRIVDKISNGKNNRQ